MSKLSRFTQLLFGSSAGSNTMAEFGSFAAGTPVRFSGSTITPALVQALSNYLTGWTGAVVGNNSPMIQDMDALCYLFSYQLAYILQEGVPEYDSSTIYYIGSVVNSSGVNYVSLTDVNQGNALTNASNWVAGELFTNVPAATSGNAVITTGQTLFNPYLTIPTSVTYTVNSGAQLVSVDTIITNGTLTVNGECKII